MASRPTTHVAIRSNTTHEVAERKGTTAIQTTLGWSAPREGDNRLASAWNASESPPGSETAHPGSCGPFLPKGSRWQIGSSLPGSCRSSSSLYGERSNQPAASLFQRVAAGSERGIEPTPGDRRTESISWRGHGQG